MPTWDRDKVVIRRLNDFKAGLFSLFAHRFLKSNLLKTQRSCLRHLRSNFHKFLVIMCDKNLGPALIETDCYKKIALSEHLQDTTTYKYLSISEAELMIKYIKKMIKQWIQK